MASEEGSEGKGVCPSSGALPLPPSPSAPGPHRLLRWPPFFFFFFLGGGDAELLDQCLVLDDDKRQGRGLRGVPCRAPAAPARHR